MEYLVIFGRHPAVPCSASVQCSHSHNVSWLDLSRTTFTDVLTFVQMLGVPNFLWVWTKSASAFGHCNMSPVLIIIELLLFLLHVFWLEKLCRYIIWHKSVIWWLRLWSPLLGFCVFFLGLELCLPMSLSLSLIVCFTACFILKVCLCINLSVYVVWSLPSSMLVRTV